LISEQNKEMVKDLMKLKYKDAIISEFDEKVIVPYIKSINVIS